MAKEGRVLIANVGKELGVFGRVAVVVVESDRGADFSHVGVEFEESGLLAGAVWKEGAGWDGHLVFVAAAEVDDAVLAHFGMDGG